MLKFTSTEALHALESAKNLNSAIKKFLKNEVGNDARSEKFIKSLRLVIGSKDITSKENFLNNHLPDFENHLFVLGRYAYLQEVDSIIEEVLTRFAEDFNTTYSRNETAVEIKDAARFKKIVLDVVALIEEKFADFGIGKSNFMKNVLFLSIFERDVLPEVIPLLD